MTNLEITRLCAKAMGYTIFTYDEFPPGQALKVFPAARDEQSMPSAIWYWPLKDDAQAMALVKKFHLSISIWDTLNEHEAGWWRIDRQIQLAIGPCHDVAIRNRDLNRAICECVAKMQQAKA